MRSITIYLFILGILAFSGCATKSPPLTGMLNWDYERDEVTYKSFIDKSVISKELYGDILGSIAGGIGGVVQREIELTPDDLLVTIETALAEVTIVENQTPTKSLYSSSTPHWDISESNEGQIKTDWKIIDGRTVGLGWWKKTYQTEVRHIITIKRSYKYNNCSNFSIDTEIRERPNSNYKWAQGDPELGRSSFMEIKKLLLGAVRKCALTERVEPSEN